MLIFAERVCDTVYDTDESKKDEFACVNVVNPVCKDVDQTIYDKVLLSVILFLFILILGSGSCDSGCENFSVFFRLAARPPSSTAAATIPNTAAILDPVVTALRRRTTASELIPPPATILPG